MLVVGPSRYKITAHRVLLAFFSAFFEAVFCGSTKNEAAEFEMPEADMSFVKRFAGQADGKRCSR